MIAKTKTRRILRLLAGILLAISVAVMYKTHRAVPFMMDDLWYSTKLCSEEPIANLRDIVESQVWHYFNWGGRSMAHGILQLTLLAGEKAADILNVAVTLLLGLVICLAAGVLERWGRLFGLWAAVSMLAGLNANWKMSMFWQAGAANYLYITVFILLFLWCYLREIGKDDGVFFRRRGARDILVAHTGANAAAGADAGDAAGTVPGLPGITFWIVPLGILAGWSNENMGSVVWLASLAVILMAARERRRIAAWMIPGNIACLFGCIMMVAAPGNQVRGAQAPENQYGLLWRLFLRCYGESKGALEYLFPTVLLLVMTLTVSKGVLKLPIGKKNLLLLLCALLSWGAMVLSPHYPDRAAFGTMTLLICAILSLWQKIIREREALLWPAFGAAALIWLRGMFFLGEFLAICWGWIR